MFAILRFQLQNDGDYRCENFLNKAGGARDEVKVTVKEVLKTSLKKGSEEGFFTKKKS